MGREVNHVGLDLDDVTLDFMGGLQRAVRKEFDIEVEPFSKWDISEVLNPILGRSWWDWLRERDWLWENFPALDGAIGTIELLRRDGFYLEIVTSKPQWAAYSVWRWLGKWRPAVHQVTIVGPEDRKVDFTKADILIDDKPENVQEFVTAGRRALLFNRPHNQGARDLRRAYGWGDVRAQLLAMRRDHDPTD